MKYNYTQETFVKELSRFFETDGYAVETVEKNNQHLTGVRLAGPDVRVSVTVYLEDFYKEAIKKGMSLKEVADKIKAIILKESERADVNEIVTLLKSWLGIRKYITYRLYSKELVSQEFLDAGIYEEVPGTDLVKVYYVYFPSSKFPINGNDDGGASVKITKEMVSAWGKKTAEVKAFAQENMPNVHPVKIASMASLLPSLFDELGEDLPDDFDPFEVMDNSCPMWVISNLHKTYGAATICYPDTLDNIENRLGEFYILPSSVHECIAVPAECADVDMLKSMVYDINRSQVEEDEWLSDHVYFYSKQKGLVMC